MTKSIIYKVTCNKTKNIYFGSTKQSLNVRISEHKCQYKRYLEGKRKYKDTISIILRENDFSYCIIEEFENISKKDLHLREGYYIDKFDCVNKVRPARSKQRWRDEHKEYMKNYSKEWRKNNLEKKKKKDKIYYEKNKKEKSKKYICVCGSETRIDNKTRHEKTKKHIDYINN